MVVDEAGNLHCGRQGGAVRVGVATVDVVTLAVTGDGVVTVYGGGGTATLRCKGLGGEEEGWEREKSDLTEQVPPEVVGCFHGGGFNLSGSGFRFSESSVVIGSEGIPRRWSSCRPRSCRGQSKCLANLPFPTRGSFGPRLLAL